MSAEKKNHLMVVRRIDFNKDFDSEERKRSTEESVNDWITQLIDLDPQKSLDRDAGKEAVESYGVDLQRQAARQSEMLKQPIRALSKQAEDGGDVGNALVELQVQVEKLDPSKFNFEPGWLLRLVGKLPGVGTPIKRYATRYRTVGSVIDAILKSLENGRDQLSRDIVTLSEDQNRMRETTVRLQRAVEMAQKLDRELEGRAGGGATGSASRDVKLTDDQRTFLQEEVLFPLRQRILDLQQQLAVNQQGVIAAELIIRNNRELVRGVNRALNVTSTALRVGATVALALETQRRVLQQVNTVGKATSDLIAGTAARLKTQGAEIHRQAAGTTLNIEQLHAAFADLNTAMTELSRFRREALPQMASTIVELDRLTAEGEKSIRRMEQSRRAQADLLPKSKR